MMIAALVALGANLAVMSGMVGGIVPEVIRLVVSLALIFFALRYARLMKG